MLSFDGLASGGVSAKRGLASGLIAECCCGLLLALGRPHRYY
jgi:hypothetical protein